MVNSTSKPDWLGKCMLPNVIAALSTYCFTVGIPICYFWWLNRSGMVPPFFLPFIPFQGVPWGQPQTHLFNLHLGSLVISLLPTKNKHLYRWRESNLFILLCGLSLRRLEICLYSEKARFSCHILLDEIIKWSFL